MTTRESLQELLERLTDSEADSLLISLPDDQHHRNAFDPTVLDTTQYPLLEAIWNNDDDAIFDELYAR